jgi:phage tail protein X
MPAVLRARQGDTLDALLHRERSLGSAAVGIVLRANRGLAELGATLPVGTPVTVPDEALVAPRTVPLVQLWD